MYPFWDPEKSTAPLVNRFLIRLLRLYQRWISPGLGHCCRFAPSCSQYAVDCLTHYPLFKAIPKAAWRILRCNPWVGGGYDPVVKKSWAD